MMLQAGYNKLFAIELILHGIDPAKFRVEYQMAQVNTMDLLRAAQRDKALSSTLMDLLKAMPGMTEHPKVMLSHFTSLSDINVKTLLADPKLTEGARDALLKKPTDPNRIQLPGAGEPSAREKA
jgi:hypothetical protein